PRSNSAWAKKAAAFRRISFARLSSRFSRSSPLIRSSSAVLAPGRLPSSRSACLTQRRSVSLEQPIFSAIDSIAAHCDGYSPSGSSTSRTARSRISREYLFASFMTPIPRKLRPPANPGRFTFRVEHEYEYEYENACGGRGDAKRRPSAVMGGTAGAVGNSLLARARSVVRELDLDPVRDQPRL